MTEQDVRQNGQQPIDQMTFADALAELEGIVSALESNTLELEDSLARYERGVALLQSLQSRISGARQKIEVLHGQLEPEKTDQEADTTLS